MKIEQSKDELKKHLLEQIMFIKKSSKDFDNGDTAEAKRLATSLRVLLHDTKNSKSLLLSLGDKEKITFLDSSLQYIPSNIMPYTGLVFMSVVNDPNGFGAEYRPLLGEGIGINSNNNWKYFNEWWDGLIIKDQKSNQFSRKNLILHVANTDGGAHVDKKLDENYVALSRRNSIGFMTVEKSIGGEEKVETVKNIELSSVRQIAFEAITSLENYYNIA